ncbi:MAG TPA: hypothetical protein VLR89_05390, partial [Anaerolineaceae bacterium]|nr:hypothetical protein [Anaerolineaceae bacterium]
MIKIIPVDNKARQKQLVEFQFELYKDCPQWVPPLHVDAYMYLNRKKHPFHEHSDVDFFIAVRDGRDVGRIAAIENKPFNAYHKVKESNFFLFDCENDPETATILFDKVAE